MDKRPRVFFYFDFDVAIVPRRATIVQPEVDMAVLAYELGRFNFDIGKRLPSALLKAKELLPAVVHRHAPRLFAGHDLHATDAVTDLVINANPVVVAQVSLARFVRMHVDNRTSALEAEHGAMIAPGRMNRPASVGRVPVEWILFLNGLFVCR